MPVHHTSQTRPLIWRKPVEISKTTKTTNTQPMETNLQFRLIITRGPRNERTRRPRNCDASVQRTRGPGHQGPRGLQDLRTRKPKEQGATNGRKDQETPEGQKKMSQRGGKPRDRGSAGQPQDQETAGPEDHLQAKPFKGQTFAKQTRGPK